MPLIKISKSAYKHNIQIIKQKTKNRVILVLKDNAYGHGATLIAPFAAELGIKFVAVKNETEATKISQYFKNILILSHIPNGKENENFIYAINDIDTLKNIKPNSKIHIAIDTLMHRNGLRPDELKTAFKIGLENNLKILGAFTHFRASDEIGCDYFIQRQIFAKAKTEFKELCNKYSMPKPLFHSHNSAGFERALKFENELDDEWARVGIAQHGYAQFNDNIKLKPTLSLWAKRISKRELKKGQKVGYGALFCADKNMQIATYDIGYGDGLHRYDGNEELFLASGQMVCGKMSMDSLVATDGGEWVCIFNNAKEWADKFNTISYDVLTKLNADIPREWTN